MDQALLLRGVSAKFHKMELPPLLTVQKILYIPYRIYQPASAGNLPIPAKLPVNRWDTTLYFWGSKTLKKWIPEDFFFFLYFPEEFFTGTWFWRGSLEFLFFTAFTGIFCRNSCGKGIPASRLQRIPPDSSGFLRIPVPAKRCLALASDERRLFVK
jgi:hypothetical protein